MAAADTGRHGLATPEEAAEYLARSVGTLANWRSQGRGPAFVGGGRALVRYRWRDLDAWIDANTRTATH